MTKLVFVADFFTTEDAKNDPEVMAILNSLGDDIEITWVDDGNFQNAEVPMSLTRKYEKEGIEDVAPDPALLAALADADILLVHWSAVNKKVIDAGPNLKFIGAFRSGFENVDVDYAKSRGIVVKNCPGRLSESVADLTLALLLDLNKGMQRRSLNATHGEWVKSMAGFENRIFRPLCMLTAGLVGFGAIAQSVARRFKACGLKVQAYDPFTPDEVFEAAGVQRVDLDTLLETSDIVSLHARVTDDTRGMIDAAAFRKMPKESVLINTARADLVDEPAMIKALEDQEIFGAGLDVYSSEPLDKNSPLLSMENVVLTPHMGGAFPGLLPLSVSMVAGELKKYLDEERAAA